MTLLILQISAARTFLERSTLALTAAAGCETASLVEITSAAGVERNCFSYGDLVETVANGLNCRITASGSQATWLRRLP
jgi:hypothetical protein